jgi:hypothetical protein
MTHPTRLKQPLAQAFMYGSMLVGLLLTAWGLVHTKLAPIDRMQLAWMIGGVVVLAAVRVFLKKSTVATGVVAAVVIAMLANAIWPLMATTWLALSSLLWGKWVLNRLGAKDENWIVDLLVGVCLLGTGVGLLAHFPVNYPAVYVIGLVIPFVLERKYLAGWFRQLQPLEFRANDGLDRTSLCLEVAICTIALAHFMVALMPEVGHDALAMHLFIPGHLATRHQWGFDVSTYVWAVMPMMGDWIFAIGYMLAGETSARLVNVGFIFLLSWLVRDLVLWAGGNAKGAKWAALLFLVTPLTLTESSSLFIESVWAAFVVAAALVVFKLCDPNGQPRVQLPTVGILLGGAFAAKAVTFTFFPVLLLWAVWRHRTWLSRSSLRPLLISIFLAIAVGGIPYFTAWYLTGNPVFPFFNQVFKSPLWPAVAFQAPDVFGKGLRWDAIYQATFHTECFLEGRPGAPGFQWLLLFFPALLMLMISQLRKAILLLVVAVLCIALTFHSTSYLRYIFPAFALVAAGIGVAMSSAKLGNSYGKGIMPALGWVVVILNCAFFKSGTYYGHLSLESLLSPSARQSYIGRQLPIRHAVELVNSLNVGRTAVAVFSSPLTAGLTADALYPNWYNYQFQAKVTQALSPEQIARLLLDHNVDFVILDNQWDSTDKRRAIESATEKMYEQGEISVRKLKTEYQFQTELLKNPNFSSHDGWALPTELHQVQLGVLRVSVTSPASQSVPVVAQRSYLNSVHAMCHNQQTQGRVQVNWLDAKSAFISTDIKVFECSQTSTLHTMKVTAPKTAAFATVYASGHTATSIVFSEVSFKQ